MNPLLNRLIFLAIDCQATGTSPKKHHLLEMGWLAFTIAEGAKPQNLKPHTVLIRPPDEWTLPRHIHRLTGFTEDDFIHAVSEGEALEMLLAQARDVARQNDLPHCPAVIHYARFEASFIRHVHQNLYGSNDLPWELFCTHQMAARLMPQLPRKGLRSVAGFLGHSVPELKRCKAHLQATAWIWHHLAQMLMDHNGIERLDGLRRWLAKPPQPKTPKVYPMPAHIRKGLLRSPGVYRMKRSNGDVLYIGKATSLRQRVNSYFHKSQRHSETILEMLSQAVDLEVTPTATALEAALLESDAIKDDQPPYNTALASRHRSLFYVSKDFKRHAPAKEKACPWGPVPSSDPFSATHALGNWLLRKNQGSYDLSQIMAMPDHLCPDHEVFESGVSLFNKQYGNLFTQKAIGASVLHIGRLSWLEQLKARRLAVDEVESAETEEEELEAFVWTPEAVSSLLESLCRRCGFLLRRARWFRILSDAEVAWRSKDVSKDGYHMLRLQQGAVSMRTQIQQIEIPRKVSKGSMNQCTYDLKTYDRLRVLTTEIRRLVAEDRMGCVRLIHGVNLYPDQLNRLLEWI